jgi:CspA family cold shock protein
MTTEQTTEQTTQQTTEQTATETLTGRVKWFNNPRGYGFLSYRDSDGTDKDVFVHYSAINCQSDNSFRTLTQGEYISFTLADSNKAGKLQAANVTGVNGGPLLSEQRSQNRQTDTRRQGGSRRPNGRGGYRGGRGRRDDRSQGHYDRSQGHYDRSQEQSGPVSSNQEQSSEQQTQE